MTLWETRPREEANLFNPPFCGLIIALAVGDYAKSFPAGMPFALAFLVLPVVLHKPTRDALPLRTTKAVSSWLDENEELKATFPERARTLSPHAREALLYALIRDRLRITDEGTLIVGTKSKGFSNYVESATEEVKDCLNRAAFVGRWLSTAGNAPTILALWGVRP